MPGHSNPAKIAGYNIPTCISMVPMGTQSRTDST